ncbi:hypothetical protein WOLCODRAFT_155645 [Wolfiporia cocos MD-104 SS10]|uniref:Uncharacterized protein n=1 Tax=Wolfiporia cocos (strain MD-104) TaxID=742152 RepID=A0A2H3IZW9_WOLCO|nr:hypothetical protein WOLCODRAFT_155645 [Wolfiporia cocos MD-104 SS10]
MLEGTWAYSATAYMRPGSEYDLLQRLWPCWRCFYIRGPVEAYITSVRSTHQ